MGFPGAHRSALPQRRRTWPRRSRTLTRPGSSSLISPCTKDDWPTRHQSSETTTSPSRPKEMSVGRWTCVQLSRSRPSRQKIWIRSFSRSGTKRRPSGEIPMPWGRWNSPGPVPGPPQDWIRVPSARKRWTRASCRVMRYTRSWESTATPSASRWRYPVGRFSHPPSTSNLGTVRLAWRLLGLLSPEGMPRPSSLAPAPAASFPPARVEGSEGATAGPRGESRRGWDGTVGPPGPGEHGGNSGGEEAGRQGCPVGLPGGLSRQMCAGLIQVPRWRIFPCPEERASYIYQLCPVSLTLMGGEPRRQWVRSRISSSSCSRA